MQSPEVEDVDDEDASQDSAGVQKKADAAAHPTVAAAKAKVKSQPKTKARAKAKAKVKQQAEVRMCWVRLACIAVVEFAKCWSGVQR